MSTDRRLINSWNSEVAQEYLPKIFEPERVDRVIDVSADEATAMTRRLANVEGVFAGMSSGGAVHAAIELAQDCHQASLFASSATGATAIYLLICSADSVKTNRRCIRLTN